MKNNNQAIVRKITGRTLRANLRRNFFITAAIALTAFMIASVFSVGMSYYETMNIFHYRNEGIRTHVGFSGLDQGQLDTIHRTSHVNHVSFNTQVGTAHLPGFEQGLAMFYADETSWVFFQTPTFTNVVGRYAEAENDIMLSRAKLLEMGIAAPYVGMEIPLSFTILGSDEVLHETFRLSAMYTEFVSAHPGAWTPVLISRAFTQKHGQYVPENFAVNVLFNSQSRAAEYAERLISALNLEEGQRYGINIAVLLGLSTNHVPMILSIGILVTFIIFVGFLLIYNVMFVSVSKDVRFYGLLKTLGTTPRQIRRIVNGQVLRLYIVGLPIGLAMGALASFGLVPFFMGNNDAVMSFSPLIYIGGALFTLFTVYISAFTSAKKAAQVSPIEAIRYAGEVRVQVKARSSAKGKPWRMAWRNVFRERKQAAVVLTSLFLSLAVYISAMTIVFGFDIESDLAAWHFHDFDIQQASFGSIENSVVRDIAAIPGVTHIEEMTVTGGRIEDIKAYGVVTAIDTAWLLALAPDIDIDIAAFERGEIALLNSFARQFGHEPEGNMLLPIGSRFDIELGGEGMPVRNVEIAAETTHLLHGTNISTTGYLPISIIMSNVFIQQHVADTTLARIGVDVQAGAESQVNAALHDMFRLTGHVNSRYEARQAMEEALLMMFVLGVGISAILGTIGIFNFINVITVGLLVRRREFAALESVGMSRKQMRAMLRWEGAVYWMITMATSLTVGTGIAYGLFSLLRSASPSQFPVFNYPLTAVLVAYGLIIAVCSIVPEAAYKSMSKLTLVERLREAE